MWLQERHQATSSDETLLLQHALLDAECIKLEIRNETRITRDFKLKTIRNENGLTSKDTENIINKLSQSPLSLSEKINCLNTSTSNKTSFSTRLCYVFNSPPAAYNFPVFVSPDKGWDLQAIEWSTTTALKIKNISDRPFKKK